MDNTEKKLNQIMNMLDLIHGENTFLFGLIKNMFTNEDDRKAMEKYIEDCNALKIAIKSGMYEDDIGIIS